METLMVSMATAGQDRTLEGKPWRDRCSVTLDTRVWSPWQQL